MDELENKLGAILNNPEMMGKIMSLAQSFGAQNDPAPQQNASLPPAPADNSSGLPELDMGTIAKLSGLMQRANIDKNQQTLLRALAPYLSQQRINKLERAMRAAKMATMASTLFGSGLFSFGR